MQLSNYLKHIEHYMYNLFSHTKTVQSAHTMCLYVPYDFHNKQRLFP
jgi:hypothetical protein